MTKYTTRMLDKAKTYGKIFHKNYSNINAFLSIHSRLVLTLELLDYYYNKWHEEYKKDLRSERFS